MIRLLVLKEDAIFYKTRIMGLEPRDGKPETHYAYEITNSKQMWSPISCRLYRLFCLSCPTLYLLEYNCNFNRSGYYDFHVYPKELR